MRAAVFSVRLMEGIVYIFHYLRTCLLKQIVIKIYYSLLNNQQIQQYNIFNSEIKAFK